MNKTDINKLKSLIDPNNIPNHIGIIMDGNGRWAKQRFMPRTAGHKEGMQRVIELVEYCADLDIKYLSLYAFSTENWKRPKEEVNGLMKLLVTYINQELDKINKNNIKIQTMGDISKLPDFARVEVEKAIDRTKNNDRMVLNIGLNYGGRDDIVTATKNIVKDVTSGLLDINSLDEEVYKKYLYTKDLPDVDLLIRPSGELRLSNFMLYQIAYSEFWFSDIFWPDFKEEDLYQAILDYQKRNRRFGGI